MLTQPPSSNFSFKCHRDPPQGSVTNVYAVNDISFHPQHGTFSTAGSDGTFHFWDKDAKHRLKGYQGNTAGYPNKVMLHPVQPDECKPRPSVKKR